MFLVESLLGFSAMLMRLFFVFNVKSILGEL